MSESQPITEADLHAYVDGELDSNRLLDIESWLLTRPDDAERIAQWTNQMAQIRAAYADILDEPVPEVLKVAAQSDVTSTRYATAAWLGAVAASFVIGMQISSWTGIGENRDTALSAGIAAHMLYTPEKLHAVEVAADNLPHLEKWLTNRVGLPVTVPNLSASGLSLMGGRVVSANGKPAALLMYNTTDGQRFTVLVLQADGNATPTPDNLQKSGVSALGWSTAGYEYVVSGSVDTEELRSLKERITPAI